MIDLIALTLVSFVNRWGPVEQMQQTPPRLPELVAPRQADPLPVPSHAEHHAPKPRDICQRHGGHRVDYVRDHHASWRCVFPHGSH